MAYYTLLTNILQNLAKTGSVLVNGSLGIVKDFVTVPQAQKQDLPCVEDFFSKERPNKPALDTPDGPKWPVVHFHKCGYTLLLTPTKFDVVNGLGDVEATRKQVNCL